MSDRRVVPFAGGKDGGTPPATLSDNLAPGQQVDIQNDFMAVYGPALAAGLQQLHHAQRCRLAAELNTKKLATVHQLPARTAATFSKTKKEFHDAD